MGGLESRDGQTTDWGRTACLLPLPTDTGLSAHFVNFIRNFVLHPMHKFSPFHFFHADIFCVNFCSFMVLVRETWWAGMSGNEEVSSISSLWLLNWQCSGLQATRCLLYTPLRYGQYTITTHDINHTTTTTPVTFPHLQTTLGNPQVLQQAFWSTNFEIVFKALTLRQKYGVNVNRIYQVHFREILSTVFSCTRLQLIYSFSNTRDSHTVIRAITTSIEEVVNPPVPDRDSFSPSHQEILFTLVW